jgi:CPA1 family monovalent cation:H+ antiporter
VLFVWIGLEVLVISFNLGYLVAGLIAIPIALMARFISVWGVMNILKFKKQFTQSSILILTWGGLRGGISIAMALSLAVGYPRGLIVMITYVVVLFAIIVQGLTIRKLIRPMPVEGS